MAFYQGNFLYGKKIKKQVYVEADNFMQAVLIVLMNYETDCKLYDLVICPFEKPEIIS